MSKDNQPVEQQTVKTAKQVLEERGLCFTNMLGANVIRNFTYTSQILMAMNEHAENKLAQQHAHTIQVIENRIAELIASKSALTFQGKLNTQLIIEELNNLLKQFQP